MNSAAASGCRTKPTRTSAAISSTKRKRRAASSSRDIARLLRLFFKAYRFDHLAPLGLFGGEEGGVLLRSAGGGEPADLGELLGHGGGLQRRHRGGVDALLHVGRR